MCRSCGHIDAADSRGRCRHCGLFSELAILPRPAAERLARQRRRRALRRRLLRLTVALALVGGVTVWALGAFFDLGPSPPRATTSVSASLGPHTWAQVRRTPQSSGFTPDAAPFPHHVTWTYRTSKPLLASPAVVEQHVYLTTGDGRTIALDRHTGQLVWEYQSGWLSSSTPAVAGDTVIFAMRPGSVVALHRQTGAQRWETHLKSPIVASPIVVHGTVYIGAADKKLYALDATTGRQRWVFATQDWIVSAVAYAERQSHRGLTGQPPACGGRGNGPPAPGLRDWHRPAHRGRPGHSGRPGVLRFCRGKSVGHRLAGHHLPTGAGAVVLADQPVPLGYALDTANTEGQRVVETRRGRRQTHTCHCP